MERVRIEDRLTGRIAEVSRPLPGYLAVEDLILLEQTVRAWCNVATEETAEREFERLVPGEPELLLYGLLWIVAAWSSLSAARIGVTVEQFIQALSYHGLRRSLSGESDQTWDTGEETIRLAVQATWDRGDVAGSLRLYGLLDPSASLLRGILLAIMDGLSQDMERNGLSPWGMTAHIIRGAGWDRTETVTYYGLFGLGRTVENPSGVLRRLEVEGTQSPFDEVFTRNLKWEPSDFLDRYRLGHVDTDYAEISKEQADAFVERVTRKLRG